MHSEAGYDRGVSDKKDAMATILDQIVKVANSDMEPSAKAVALRNLAEAHAWLVAPDVPHGGASSD